jgi:outer membrane lipoprotein-sorting protein
MRTIVKLAGTALFLVFFGVMTAQADDLTKLVKKAVEESTLDQPRTKPFHLRAEFAPSFERDNETHRTGVIEIWWESPTQWRREVRSPEFHQITVVNGEKV